jgi:hypothetical protein
VKAEKPPSRDISRYGESPAALTTAGRHRFTFFPAAPVSSGVNADREPFRNRRAGKAERIL